MKKKDTILTILILGLISACIYGLQILLFHDLRNTEFYILQDLAFIPISIAITTIVVGNIVDGRARKEAAEKAGMLRSVFFTDMGHTLIKRLSAVSDAPTLSCQDADMRVSEQQDKIRSCTVTVHSDQETYEFLRSFLQEKKQDLIILTGNNQLMDQDDFTQMLSGLFHLMDEFELRGSYDDLTADDRSHMDEDFAKVLVLLEINSAANSAFQRKHFPNFYQKARDSRN